MQNTDTTETTPPPERPSSPPRSTSTAPAQLISSPDILCEEHFDEYDPKRWRAVHIGEVLDGQFQAVAKLGCGKASTAWLCRDLENHCYVTLKIFALDEPQAQLELATLEHLGSWQSKHPGQKCLRNMLGCFKLQGRYGEHICIIFEPLGPSIDEVRVRYESGRLPIPLIKAVLSPVLSALDYLHTRPKVVHADINPGNIMMTSKLDAYFDNIAQAEWDDPSPHKVEGDRVVYGSRTVDMPDQPGTPLLCDFGHAVNSRHDNHKQALPDLYRSPEMVLTIPWREKIDIWAIGCLVWDLYEGKPLFKHLRERGLGGICTGDDDHLGILIGLLGTPPKDLLERGIDSHRYFDEEGNLNPSVHVPDLSFESELTRPVENEDDAKVRKLFFDFLRMCLQWRPEDRAKARQLLAHPFLKVEMTAIAEEDEEEG